MGYGYYGSKLSDQHRFEKKFAWRPILTTSGKWIWWRDYVKLMKIYWGIAGESPAVDAEFYTEGEWLLESIKNDYPYRQLPCNFFRSSV